MFPRRFAMLLALGMWLVGGAVHAAPIVELEVATDPAAPVLSQQSWHQVFSELRTVRVTLRPQRAGDDVSMRVEGSGNSAIYHINGILSSGGELVVPGHRFRPKDRSGVKAWIDDLLQGRKPAKSGGAVNEYGLTEPQMAHLLESLAAPVEESTLDAEVSEVFGKVRGQITLPIDLRPDAAGKLASLTGAKFTDELQGVACGTALAAVLRSEGLAWIPSIRGNDVRLSITTIDDAGKQAWPVGRRFTQYPNDVAPGLFEFVNSDIRGTALAEAIQSIRQASNVPILCDQYALARHKIDPRKVFVSLPPKRSPQIMLIKQLASQAKLTATLYVDEAQHPVVWITTMAPP